MSEDATLEKRKSLMVRVDAEEAHAQNSNITNDSDINNIINKIDINPPNSDTNPEWNFKTTITPRQSNNTTEVKAVSVPKTKTKTTVPLTIPVIEEDLELIASTESPRSEISPQGYNNQKMGRFSVEQIKRASSENIIYLEPSEWSATDCGDWVVSWVMRTQNIKKYLLIMVLMENY